MRIEDLQLRRGVIEALHQGSGRFTIRDDYDASLKTVSVRGKMRMYFHTFKVGDTAYAAINSEGNWQCITGTNFKMMGKLAAEKPILDELLDGPRY